MKDFETPQNFEAEQSSLGAMLMDSEALETGLELLTDDDFYRQLHKKICGAMRKVASEGQEIDAVTLSVELQRRGQLEECGGFDYLHALAAACPSPSGIESYARIVRENAERRALIKMADDLKAKAYDISQPFAEVKDFAEGAVLKVGRDSNANDCLQARDIIPAVIAQALAATDRKGEISGLPTGFADLDRKTDGFQPSQLIVLAAVSSMGKSALAMQMMHAVAKTGKPVLFFNFEMSKDELIRRLTCTLSKVDSKKVKRGTMSDDEKKRFARAAQEIRTLPLFIQDTPGMTTAQMRARARRIRSQYGPIGLIAADYLQIIEEGGDLVRGGRSRADGVAKISLDLYAMALEQNCTCLALSQLTKEVEKREDKRPNVNDLLDSGAIRHKANGIWFLYREGHYREMDGRENIAEIIIGKHRDGELGVVKVLWEGAYTRFDNLTRSFDEAPDDDDQELAPVWAPRNFGFSQ